MPDIASEAQLLRESVEGDTADDTRAHLGEEAFRLGGIGMEEVIGHGEAQHGVAEVLHAFVADVIVAHALDSHRFMGESHMIQSDIPRIETEDIVDILVECFVLGIFWARK